MLLVERMPKRIAIGNGALIPFPKAGSDGAGNASDPNDSGVLAKRFT